MPQHHCTFPFHSQYPPSFLNGIEHEYYFHVYDSGPSMCSIVVMMGKKQVLAEERGGDNVCICNFSVAFEKSSGDV